MAYTMWWTEGSSPNDLITQALGETVPDTCDVAYFHKDGPPTPMNPNPYGGYPAPECQPWHANSCCHEATVISAEQMNSEYGPGFGWDRCGPLSQGCERFFVAESCMYECDVNAGLYRKYTDAQHAACSADGVAIGAAVTLSDGTAYTCTVNAWGGNDENRWQLHEMPIKASYADAWYRACANDFFSGGEDCGFGFFSCPIREPSPPSPPDLAPGEMAVEIAASAMELQLSASADWSADPSPIGEIKTWLQAELQCFPDATATLTPCQLSVSLLDARRRLAHDADVAVVDAAEALEAGGAAPRRRRLATSAALLRVTVVLDAEPDSLAAVRLDSLAD